MRFESVCFQENKKELKEAVIQLVLSTAPKIFATAVFNDYASPERGRLAIKRFHANLDRKLYGKCYHQVSPQKRTFFFAFPENINSNFHFHLLIRPPLNHLEKVIDVAPNIWKKICPSGNLKLSTISSEEDLRKVSFYSTKESFIEKNFEHFIISNEFIS